MSGIHDFEKQMAQLRARIRAAPMSEDDKQLLLGFERHCAAEGLSLPRQWKLIEYMYSFRIRYFSGSLRTATQDQIWDAVLKIEARGYTPWTRHDFKVAIRKFYKYVIWGQEALRRKDYPDLVSGISTRIKKRDQICVQAADILSEDEVEAIIRAAGDTQKKALLVLMYEMGARVGEIGGMRIGSVSRDRYSYVCDINGKTGPRSVRVVRSGGMLAAWLNSHPERDEPRAPLWGFWKAGQWQRASYGMIQTWVRKIAREAGVKKRVHPHLFRHSSITHALAGGRFNEAQAKVYYGLVQDSRMLATYSHLLAKDANDAILKAYGIAPKESDHKAIVDRCWMCGETNDRTGKFCGRCGHALSQAAAEDSAARTAEAGDMIRRFMDRPGIAEEFRRMVRQEVESGLAAALRERFAPQARPMTEQNQRRPDAA